MTYVALDFETATGSHNSACALGMVRFADGKITDEFYTLINPPVVKFDLFNIGIHGIHQEDVKDAPTFADIADQVRAFIGDSVVLAHNAGFDLKVLKATVRYYGIDFEDVDYICTWKLSKKLYPELPSRSLDSLARRINFTFSHHNALEDAKACAAVFHRMEEELFPESITSVIKPSRYCFRDFGMLYSQQ